MASKTTNYFTNFSNSYDKVVRTANWRAPESVLYASKAMQPDAQRSLKILDVAAGTGELSVMLKKAFPNAEIHGVDLSTEMLSIAIEENRLDANRTKIADLTTKYPYEDSEFDLVVCSGAAEYFGQPESILKEMGRVTKPNGTIVSTFRYNCASNHAIHGLGTLQNWMSFLPGIQPIANKTVTSARKLKETAKSAGLENIECSPPYTAYIQNLLAPLPITIGPPVKYLTLAAKKPAEPSI